MRWPSLPLSAQSLITQYGLNMHSLFMMVTTLACMLLPHILYARRVQRLYIATSRELKRLDALAFSPIFQHYGESLAGLATIRAFGRQHLFIDTNRVSCLPWCLSLAVVHSWSLCGARCSDCCFHLSRQYMCTCCILC
jgi:hypothetical protein